MNVTEAQETVRSGQHPLWREAVRTFLAGKTKKLRLHIVEAYLIFSYQISNNWFSALARLRREKPYDQIADYHRETPGPPVSARLTPNGELQLGCSEDASQEPVVAMFPVGLLFIGHTQRGGWGDEEAYVNASILAELIGCATEQVLQELDTLVTQYANRRIREITNAGDRPMTIKDPDSGKIIALTGDFEPPEGGPVN